MLQTLVVVGVLALLDCSETHRYRLGQILFLAILEGTEDLQTGADGLACPLPGSIGICYLLRSVGLRIGALGCHTWEDFGSHDRADC